MSHTTIEMGRYVRKVVHNRLQQVWYFQESSHFSTGWTSDIAQDSILAVLRNNPDNDLSGSELRTYCAVTAHRAVRDFLTKLKNRKTKSGLLTPHEILDMSSEAKERRILFELREYLTEEEFEAVGALLSKFTFIEISEMMNLTLNSVRKIVSRVRSQMANELEKQL